MSYLTIHHLEAEDGGPSIKEVAAALAAINQPKPGEATTPESDALQWEIYLEGTPCKWTNVSDQLRLVTPKWPDTMFWVWCRGEDDNLWVDYHQNGMVGTKHCEPFNPGPPYWAAKEAPPEPVSNQTLSPSDYQKLEEALEAEHAVLEALIELRDSGKETLDADIVIQWCAGAPTRLRHLINNGKYHEFQPLAMPNQEAPPILPATPGYLLEYARELRARASA